MPRQPEFLMWTIFKKDLQRNIPAKFGPSWPSNFIRGMLEIVEDGHSTFLKAHFEHIVL